MRTQTRGGPQFQLYYNCDGKNSKFVIQMDNEKG
jgi:hypothetical protein